MHFNQAFASLLLSSALTSLVASAPVDVGAEVSTPEVSAHVRRDNDAFGINAKDATWDKYGKFCSGGSTSKRDLEKRAPNAPISPAVEVTQGQKNQYIGIPLGLWTWRLVTCIGVVVIGKTKDGQDARFLAHLQAARGFIESEWDAFEKSVKDANLDHDTAKGFISFPDLSSQLPVKNGGWDKDLADLASKVEDHVRDKMDHIVDGNPTVVHRFMKPVEDDVNDINGIMSVDGNNKVVIAGSNQN